MRFIFIAVWFSTLLSVCVPRYVYAQERTFSFTWFDKDEREMSGMLTTTLNAQPAEGQYRIDLNVTWFDRSGNPITDNARKPVLCLSKWDYELIPGGKVTCTTFGSRQVSSLVFPESEQLNIQVQKGYEGPVTLTASFLYALSKEKFESGKSEKVDFRGSGLIRYDFTVRNPEKQLTGNNPKRLENIQHEFDPVYQRGVARRYLDLYQKVQEINKISDAAVMSQPGYLQELEALTLEIENGLMLLDPDSLPADSLAYYREAYNRINRQVLDRRSAFVRQKLSATDLISDAEKAVRARRNDSIRQAVQLRTEPVFRRQLDSLDQLILDEKALAVEIQARMERKGGGQDGGPELDSLMSGQNRVRNVLENLNASHDNEWSNYRIDIDGLLPVREVENLHSTFVKLRNDLESTISQADANLAGLTGESGATPWYMSGWVIWVALFTVLALVFVLAVWSTVRSRRIVAEQITSIEQQSASGGIALRVKGGGNFSDEISGEYLTIDYREPIPESVVGLVHFHHSAVKSIYHQVQAALLEKRATAFGGFLFGNQYRLTTGRSASSELFIEKVCESAYLRSSISNDNNARADLVDEMNRLVGENRKLRLVGWFTSAADSSMEIPEGLMKIHRTFFKEKWQVGVLINPASDVLQGAAFLRRSTGYLDPLPDPAAFMNWDNLYRQVLSPAGAARKDPAVQETRKKEYAVTDLNNTWVDSIVTRVFFDKQAAADILAAAAQQAIPRETYQLVGYLYGKVTTRTLPEGKGNEYEVYVDRFIELTNEPFPRELPGSLLLGWWGQAQVDILTYLHLAIAFHEQTFPEHYQMACLANPATGELRIFTRKHSLEMNNSTIETEEYTLNSVLSG
jgi:hypothetical protein